jgi:hypothetical protein
MIDMDYEERIIEQLRKENKQLRTALKVAEKMLSGTCQHGYDTSKSARGCDECAEQIEQWKN